MKLHSSTSQFAHVTAWKLDTVAKSSSWRNPKGYVRTFVDEVPLMAAILSEARSPAERIGWTHPSRHTTSEDSWRRWSGTLRAPRVGRQRGLPEPLERAGAEVLQLLAAGKSNRRISSRALRQRGHRQDPHQQPLPQTGCPQPHAGGGARQGLGVKLTLSEFVVGAPKQI